MTDQQKLSSLAVILQCCSPYALRSRGGRRALSRQISIGLGMYLGRVESFVEEMSGLDLSLPEERDLFLQFAERGL
jgi:hypothetical protein